MSDRPAQPARAPQRLIPVIAVILVLAGGAVAAGVTLTAGSQTKAPSRRVVDKKATATDTTFLGSYGEEASWVVAENKKRGTTAWRITDTPKIGKIQGFADVTYASVGQMVTLYVSSTAPSYRIEAFRMGYYGGAGARLVWTSSTERGQVQPTCPTTPNVNMVSCTNWSKSITITITKSFVQGDYLFKLVGSGNEQSYVPLTVWDPTSTATYLVKNDVFTWQAWNPYGGYDFYQGQGACTFGTTTSDYPPCNRARVVSYDRPYAYGEGAADFLVNEYPLVRFAEQHGLDVTYVTDVTVEQHPTILTNHRVLLSLGHDECWSLTEREAAVRAQDDGVNIVFFAASAVLRHVRLQSSALGPDRELVDYRDSSEDPLDGKGNPLEVTGNSWSQPPASWPETAFVGENYAGYREPGTTPVDFIVADDANWLFRGTGLHKGSKIPDVLASDFDEFEVSEPHPSDLEILGHSPIPAAGTQQNVSGQAYSDMTYYTDPTSKAGVFDTGTNNWIPELTPCSAGPTCRQRTIARITGNLLRLFGEGPSGKIEPSVANWQAVEG